MLKKIISFCFLSLLISAHPVTAAETGKITGGVSYEIPDWFKQSFLEIAEDVEEAADEDKHVLLFFHLNDCPYCNRMLNENFAHDPIKQQIQQNFDSIAINIRGDREIAMSEDLNTTERVLADYLKIQYTPTIIFLNHDNKTVLRLNGYRSPEALKQALDFVQSKAYLSSSFSDFKRSHMQYGKYQFIQNPMIQTASDLSTLQGPVALLFEDNDCNECSHFHQKMMTRPEIRDLFKRLTLIRLDAKSTKPITGFDGTVTSPLKLASELGLNYRPGIVLFDEGKEVSRVESMLFPFHFSNTIRMALDKNHEKYPSAADLGRERQQQLLSQGLDVNVGKPEDW
jgi:thioredoxin-related protein